MNVVIDLKNPLTSNRILSNIQRKQNGNCRYCKRKFNPTDIVVSNRNGKTYYHKFCAEKLNII